MKKGLGIVLAMFFGLIWSGGRQTVLAASRVKFDKSELTAKKKSYVPGEVLVKFKVDKINLESSFSLGSSLRKFIFGLKGYETAETIKSGNLVVLKVAEGEEEAVAAALKEDSNVEYAEPNYYLQPASLSINDTYKNNLWGLDNVGQTITLSSGVTAIGTSGADIEMQRAWNVATGTSEVVVAVIDTGVAYNHPDLSEVMWDGTSCVDENGDSISGGCPHHGYEFTSTGGDDDPLPTDSTHGTHVAGTIAAEKNNSKGISGVGSQIKIMAVKFDMSNSAAVKAIDFARYNGVKVINASWGGSDYSSALYEAINSFRTAGGIFVAAAGNETANNDGGSHTYPSDYDLDNIISVAATDQNDLLAGFSNYGTTSVDVAAPGVNIYSAIDEVAVVDDDFDDLVGGSLPSYWTSDLGSSWFSFNMGSGVTNVVVFTDENVPYLKGINSVVTSDTVDLSAKTNGKFEFIVYCDTEFTSAYGVGDSSSDYLALEVSSDGTNFTELGRWNEYELRNGNFDDYGYYDLIDDLNLDSQYLTSSFKYRWRWVTDSDSDTGNGYACFIDDFKLLSYSDGSEEGYDYKDGTSMAAPHVAGLAGYLWSVVPSASQSEIINAILDTGETLASLSGKIVTGRRINAYNAISSLGVASSGPEVTGISNDSTPAKSKTFTWSSANPTTDVYRFSVDQSESAVPMGVYTTIATVTISTGDGVQYLHVQAKDADENEGPVKTVSFILDNSGPVASLGSNELNLFTLSFGETLYDNVGATLAVGSDLGSRFSSSEGIGLSSVSYESVGTISIGISGTPIAGMKVNQVGGTDNAFYDNLTNVGTTSVVYFDGEDWQINPTSLNVGASYFEDLINTGWLSLGVGESVETAVSLTAQNNVTINIGNSGTNSSIGLTAGTIISEHDDQAFNATLISGSVVDPATVSGLGTGYTAQGAIQWGITGTTLKFSQPILVAIYVGSSWNGQAMNVYRSAALDSGWTTEALSASTCTVAGGYCTLTATEASYYVAAALGESEAETTPTPAPTSAPTENNQSSNNGPPGLPACGDRVPLSAPDLFKIETTKGSARIVFTPVREQISSYAVMYGFKKGDERFAAIFSPIHNNEGEQNFVINQLNPKLTYYFKVTAYNGCVSGPWSEWIPAKADRKKTIHKYMVVIKNKVRTLVNRFATK